MTGAVIELGDIRDGMREKLAAAGASADACYQCLRCTSGCPMISFMDVPPHRIVRMAQYGLSDQALESRTIWMCASCQTCTTRCPNEVDIAHLMDVLRQESMRRGVQCPESAVEKFHRAFLKEVRRGRVHELSLIGRYKLATRRFTDDMRLGLEMFKRGRIKLLPPRVKGASEVENLFKIAEKGK